MARLPEPSRILLIRRDNIGDLVCTTPVFRALRERWPRAHIGVLVNSYNAPVLENNPDVDAVYAYTKAKQLAGCPVARIFRIGYVELKRVSQSGRNTADDPESMRGKFSGGDNVKRALRRAISTETTRMTQMVPFLATTGNTTPFIGLFGTVWGIINSFHGIGQSGSASLAIRMKEWQDTSMASRKPSREQSTSRP